MNDLPAAGPRPVRRLTLDAGLILLAVGVETMVATTIDSGLPVFGTAAPLPVVSLGAVVAYLPLLQRRQFPRAVLIWMCALGCLDPWLGDYVPFVGLVIACFAVGQYCTLREGLPVGLFLVPPIAVGVSGSAALLGVLWAVVFAAFWWAGRSLQIAELARRQQRELLLEAARLRRRQERAALARELHDSVAGSITAMVLQATGARAMRRRDQAPPEPALDLIIETGGDASREMHRLLDLLRAEDDSLDIIITESASHEDLPELVRMAERRGLHVDLEVDGAPHEVSASVSTAAYRVVQESLTNALKHAGTGSSVDVEVHWHSDDLELEVRSHAHRRDLPPLPSTGYGLAGLGERIRSVGGTFSFRQEKDAFVTSATLPLAGT